MCLQFGGEDKDPSETRDLAEAPQLAGAAEGFEEPYKSPIQMPQWAVAPRGPSQARLSGLLSAPGRAEPNLLKIEQFLQRFVSGTENAFFTFLAITSKYKNHFKTQWLNLVT